MTTLEKAKATTYKHPKWFKEGNKTVYEAMKYFAYCNDFYIDTTLKCYPESYPDYLRGSRESLINWLIDKEDYKNLVIRYTGREGGTDKGALKIKTFLLIKSRQYDSIIASLDKE